MSETPAAAEQTTDPVLAGIEPDPIPVELEAESESLPVRPEAMGKQLPVDLPASTIEPVEAEKPIETVIESPSVQFETPDISSVEGETTMPAQVDDTPETLSGITEEIAHERRTADADTAPENAPEIVPETSGGSEGELSLSKSESEAMMHEEPAPTTLDVTTPESTTPALLSEPAAAEPESEDPIAQVAELVDFDGPAESDEPQPVAILDMGTVIRGRYQVIELLEETEQGASYKVRDLQRCPRCQSSDNSPDQAFCASCGALMEQKPVAVMLQRSAEQDFSPPEVEPEDHLSEGGQAYWVWRETKPSPLVEETQRPMSLIVGQQSDTGQVRELDEDSLFVLVMSSTYESVTHQLSLFVVADGMGGHEGGEVASRLSIQTLVQALLRDVFAPELAGKALSPEAIQDRTAAAVRAANDRVYLERQKRDNDMGTTVTVALIKDWTLYLAHVGDCRAYRWGPDGLQQLTTDHSIVAGMVAAGTALPEEIYTHPQRSVIYRCIGDRPTIEVDSSTLQLDSGDRLVLCCDGLWEMLRNEGVEEVMLRESDPQAACDLMVEQANLAGGTDNISVIIVQL
jgi:serine/threonine protein phosphatase PrpC